MTANMKLNNPHALLCECMLLPSSHSLSQPTPEQTKKYTKLIIPHAKRRITSFELNTHKPLLFGPMNKTKETGPNKEQT